MVGPSPADKRRQEVEAWWFLIVRVLSFVLGAVILIGLVFFVEDRPVYAWLSGIALCGPTVAASVATMLESVRGVAQ